MPRSRRLGQEMLMACMRLFASQDITYLVGFHSCIGSPTSDRANISNEIWEMVSEFLKQLQIMFIALKPRSYAAVLTGRVAIAQRSFHIVTTNKIRTAIHAPPKKWKLLNEPCMNLERKCCKYKLKISRNMKVRSSYQYNATVSQSSPFTG